MGKLEESRLWLYSRGAGVVSWGLRQGYAAHKLLTLWNAQQGVDCTKPGWHFTRGRVTYPAGRLRLLCTLVALCLAAQPARARLLPL